MYCPSCGKQIPENSTFCLYCGTRIAAPEPVDRSVVSPPKRVEWEYTDFVYKFLPPGQGMWAKLGSGAYSEAGAKLEFWQNSQREITAELQKWIDEGWEPVGEVGSSCIEIKTGYSHRDKSPLYWILFLLFSIPTFGVLFLIALLARSNIAEPIRFVLQMRAPKGTKTPTSSKVPSNIPVNIAFKIPIDELEKWRKAFTSLGWFERFGPRTEQTLAHLSPSLNTATEPLLFVAYDGTRGNHISSIQVDTVSFRAGFMAAIATEWRIILADTTNLKPYAFLYEDISSIAKVEAKGKPEVQYILYTKSGHTIRLSIQLDAPNMTGLLRDFQKGGDEVLKFFDLFFARITPSNVDAG